MATLIPGKALQRSFLLYIFAHFIHLTVTGQAVMLPVDPEGKVEYHDSVLLVDGDYHNLWGNAIGFLNALSVPDQLAKEVKVSGDMRELSHQIGFYLYTKPGLTQQIDGVMMADITLTIEEGKYEYRIHNFRFIKYARDRFGKFSPESTKKYALELYYPDSKKRSWQAHFVEINSKMLELEQKMNTKLTSFRNFN
jgi:hypothetical protein